MYVRVCMTVWLGLVIIRTAGHYRVQIYIVPKKLLKQDESSVSLGNNAVNMEKHTENKLWEKKKKMVMVAKIPHCFWKASTRRPKANLWKIVRLWLLFSCYFCTLGNKFWFFFFFLACGTQSTRGLLTTRNKSGEPEFMNSFKGMSDKGYFVLPSNVFSF